MAFPNNILFDKHPEYTRKKKRNLLMASFISWSIAFANIIPKDVTAIGIHISNIEPKPFLIILGALITYYLLDYYSSVWIDNERSNGKIETEYEVAYENKEDEMLYKPVKDDPNYIKKQSHIVTQYSQPWQYALSSVLLRMFLDLLFPFIFYIVAITFIIIRYFNL